MAKKINQGKEESIPTVSASEIAEQENPTLTKDYVNNAPVPVSYLENKGLTARADHDEVENENADDDVIRKSVVSPSVPDRGVDAKVGSYSDIVSRLRRDGELSSEEIAKQDKRAKVYRSLALLSDGVSAIGNMVGAIGGAKPYKAGGALNEYGARYREMLAERRANNKYWQEHEARARLGDARNRFDVAMEGYKTGNAKSVAGVKHGYAVGLEGVRHKNGLEKLGVEHDYNIERDSNKFNQDRKIVEYKEKNANARNSATNNTRIKVSKNGDNSVKLIDSDGTKYEIDDKWLNANYGALYDKIVNDEEFEGDEPKLYRGKPLSAKEKKDYVKVALNGSPKAKALLKSMGSSGKKSTGVDNW